MMQKCKFRTCNATWPELKNHSIFGSFVGPCLTFLRFPKQLDVVFPAPILLTTPAVKTLGQRSRYKELGTFRNGQVARIWVSSIDVLAVFFFESLKKSRMSPSPIFTKLIIKTFLLYIHTHQKTELNLV